MKNIDIVELKKVMTENFFFLKYHVNNKTYDFIPDEFVLKVIEGNLEEEFTEKEISHIHYLIGIAQESKLRNSGNARGTVVKKLNHNLNLFRCEQKGETFIEVLNLSKRSYNALISYDIISVEQLILCSKEQLDNIRNLGEVFINEIIEKVHEYGEKFIFEKQNNKDEMLQYRKLMNKYNDQFDRLKKLVESNVLFEEKKNEILECIEKMDQHLENSSCKIKEYKNIEYN